ncbi:reverse transcriptase domain-containing protein [Tanacetum coccineum]|uniref:Reverse transcriptase domain-containing protein n=1 Tax=Tanacetum coccineum TaxID=301880 RepID=A0ABQ5A8U3_9ASTR
MAPKRATRSTPVTTTPAPTATTTTTVTNAQLQAMIDQGVSAVLAARDATRNGIDSHTSGTGVRGSERVARECTYQDFMKCKPLYFKGTEGVVELTQWFERMETVFRISNCSVENQIKFSTCTLLAGALTWWNSHVMTVTHDIAYSMTWVDLRKKMTDKYCPRNEMKKLEAELWNLKVIGTDVVKYNQRFQELALLCVRMFPEESDKIERYVGGLPDMIHGNIVASKPKTMQEAIEMATELMDKRVSTMAERQAENKRKFENTSRNNQNQQQQQDKRQNTGRAYTAGSGDKKQYGGSRPLCSKCNYHHDGPCAPKCYKCNKYGHIARDCRGTGNANNINNQKGTGSGQKPTCFECGVQGHFKKECPRMKNNRGNRGNQAGNDRAPAKVYVVGNAGANPDNVIAGCYTDNRTMTQMLQAPIEGYEDAIVVPPINANNFELKQPLINLVQSNKFTGRQDPHNHLRVFNKVTSTFRHPEVPNTSIKLLLFPFSLDGEARDWLDKEPPRSILTWDDLVLKFINQFFPPSKTTYLRNEITTFYQKPNKTFNEAWERFKGLLRQCPHHGFSELHQLDTFYNSLNTNDQDALDSVAGGNFLDKMPREGLAIIKSKSKVRYSRSHPNNSRAIMNAPSSTSSPSNNSFEIQQMAALLEDKMNIRMSRLEKAISEKNATTPATVKEVEEVCVTCGSNHNFNNYPLTRNDFPVFQDNIHQFQQTAAVGNFVQRNPPNLANQMRPPRAVYQAPPYQPPTNQHLVNQALSPVSQIQGVSKMDFDNYVKANDAVLKNVQNQEALENKKLEQCGREQYLNGRSWVTCYGRFADVIMLNPTIKILYFIRVKANIKGIRIAGITQDTVIEVGQQSLMDFVTKASYDVSSAMTQIWLLNALDTNVDSEFCVPIHKPDGQSEGLFKSRVSPWKGVIRFGKRGKLNPRYVGHFKVLEKVGEVAYKLELPKELSRVHNTFHVSNLKKCYADEPLVVPLDGLHFDDKLQFVEEPIEITDREVKRLK